MRCLISLTSLAALAAGALTGCADAPTGTYHATWTLTEGDAPTSCDVGAVTTVAIEARDLVTSEVRSMLVPCAAGEATLREVPLGEHELTAVARGAYRELAGRAAVSARLDAATDVDAPPLRLAISSPTTTLLLNWELERLGAPVGCDAVGATDVHVVATPVGGGPAVERRWPCAPRAEFLGLPIGPYELAVTLLAADDAVLATSAADAIAPQRGLVERVVVFHP